MKSTDEIVELLNSIPYFMARRRIPPRHILNDLMRQGVRDSGMSGRVEWKPFEIGESEYEAVVQELRQRGMETVDVQTPSDVNSYDLWQEWCMVARMGEDAPELGQLLSLRRELKEKRRALERQGDEDAARRLQLQCFKIDARVSEIMVNKKRK